MSTLETSVPTQSATTRHSARRHTSFWSLLHLLRSHYRLMGLVIGTGILNQGFTIAGAAVGAFLVGAAVTGSSVTELVPLLWLLGGLVLGRALAAWSEMWLAHDLAYRLLADIRGQIYWALERLAPGYLLDRRSGELTAAAMSDVETLEWFYAHTVGAFVIAVVVPLAAIITLGVIDWRLPLVLLPLLLLVATIPFWLNRRAARQGQTLRAQLGAVNAEVVDSVQGLREIVTFGRSATQLEKLGRHNRALVQAQLAHGSRAGIEGAVTDALIALGMVSVLALAAYLVAQGILAAALFPVSIILAASSFGPIVAITSTARNIGVITAAADRVFAIIQSPAPVTDTALHPPVGPIVPHVRFTHVSFRYSPDLPDAVRDVSFAIAPGETVALAGHSGAGKSTCTHLLLRFWDVTSGAITIGGHDLRDVPQAALRDLIALVPQDIYLFNTTVRENIRLGKPDATAAEVEEAARLALAHDFIARLPNGYDSLIGERGAQLSGGQRQRIAIARALLKNAPILVMDEAVSNLDTENERALQAALARLRAGRTTLIIAHRLSTIRSADRIVVLENGRVAETGTHAELMEQAGVYTRLIKSQHNTVLFA
ncbi:MAG: ABC transporter ATP-binding protein [Chloroflexaceae bacterium]